MAFTSQCGKTGVAAVPCRLGDCAACVRAETGALPWGFTLEFLAETSVADDLARHRNKMLRLPEEKRRRFAAAFDAWAEQRFGPHTVDDAGDLWLLPDAGLEALATQDARDVLHLRRTL